MEKLIVCIMGQNCERTLPICYTSVENADEIVYCDGGSTDKSKDYIFIKSLNNLKVKIIENKYDQEDKQMNGKQRNFYLKYLKENYPNDWALCLDADEVVEDIKRINDFIQEAQKGVYSVKMRHFIGDLGHEDATTKEHLVLNRLFKISEANGYPEVEHPVLQGNNYFQYRGTTIWHLAYIPNLWEIKRRYDNHLKKSNMHTPEFLRNWYYQHLFGQYPRTPINLLQIPGLILKEFGIDKDEFYFMDRKLEVKHFLEARQWKDFFNPSSVLEVGCGLGNRVMAMQFLGIDAKGFDISPYAVKHSICKGIFQEDLAHSEHTGQYDLVIAYDVLEHMDDYAHVDSAISKLSCLSKKYILVSIPFLGDPNLENDPTHKIKETKEWWIEQFTKKGMKIIQTPEHFLFKEQMLIFEQ